MSDSLPGVAARLAAMRGWRRRGAAVACGAAFALAQPPLGLWPLIFLAGPAIYWLWRGGGAFGVGLWFGAGFFGLGMHWIVEPFLVHASDMWMAPLALPIMAFGMGLFPAAAFWLAGWAADRGAQPLASLALAWGGLEATRSFILTGFPWALPAYVWVDTPVAQLASLVGPYALSLLTIAVALAPARSFGRGARRAAPAALALVAVIGAWVWGAARLPAEPAADRPLIRIVQPNLTQSTKWDVDLIRPHFEKTLALSAGGLGAPPPALILWPESAVTFPIDMAPEARAEIARAANGAEVALGSLRVDGGPEAASEGGPVRWRNSLFLLDGEGALSKPFDKIHLVPFGEYLPLETLLSRLGILALAQRGAGIVPGEAPVVLTPANAPPFAPLICYEMIFPREVQAAAQGAEWLALVTNDAWFGDWAGPIQHLAQAQMRAIETGLPIARSANTGISAMIDAYGRITARLPMNEAGAIDAPLPARTTSHYADAGEIWSILFAAMLLIFAAAGFHRSRN